MSAYGDRRGHVAMKASMSQVGVGQSQLSGDKHHSKLVGLTEVTRPVGLAARAKILAIVELEATCQHPSLPPPATSPPDNKRLPQICVPADYSSVKRFN